MLKKDNTNFITILIFYEHRKTMLFNVLGSVIFGIMEKYCFLDDLCIQQDKPSSNDRSIKDTTFYDFSGIVIPEVLMNIMSCNGFAQEVNTTVILKCHWQLFSYYLSKDFVILYHRTYALENINLTAKQQIHKINKHPSDCYMTYNRSILSVLNTLKKIHLNSDLFDDLSRNIIGLVPAQDVTFALILWYVLKIIYLS